MQKSKWSLSVLVNMLNKQNYYEVYALIKWMHIIGVFERTRQPSHLTLWCGLYKATKAASYDVIIMASRSPHLK